MAIEFKSPTVAKNTITDRLEKQGREAKLQEKSVEYTENNDYQVLPDEGFDGMTKVNVSVDVAVPTVQNSKTVNITANGTQTISPDNGYDVVEQVVVNTNVQPNLQEKTVDVLLTDTTTNIRPDSGFDGMSSVTVNHPPVESNTAYTATSNGSYTIHPSEGFDATTSVNLTVNVTNPPTAYDITDPRVRLGFHNESGNLITTQADIDQLTGWENLTIGNGKCNGIPTTGKENNILTFNLPNLTNMDGMFNCLHTNTSCPFTNNIIKFTPGSLKKVTSAQNAFNNLSVDFSGLEIKGFNNNGNHINLITNDFLTIDGSFHTETCLSDDLKLRIKSSAASYYGNNSSIRKLNIQNVDDNCYGFYSFSPGLSIREFITNMPFTGDDSSYDGYFYRCSVLTTLQLPIIKYNLYLDSCESLSQESVNNVLNALADGVTGKQITFASTQYGYITEEQKAAATAKGWTIKSA